MIDLPTIRVPLGKKKDLDLIQAKEHSYYAGYVRCYVCGNDFYEIDTRYDDDMIAAGILPSKAKREKDE